MEEAGTWWRTLGPYGDDVSRGCFGGRGGGETFIDVEGGKEDCFEHFQKNCVGSHALKGSVIGVAVHIMLMEFGWRRERKVEVYLICGPATEYSTIRSETLHDFLDLSP